MTYLIYSFKNSNVFSTTEIIFSFIYFREKKPWEAVIAFFKIPLLFSRHFRALWNQNKKMCSWFYVLAILCKRAESRNKVNIYIYICVCSLFTFFFSSNNSLSKLFCAFLFWRTPLSASITFKTISKSLGCAYPWCMHIQ